MRRWKRAAKCSASSRNSWRGWKWRTTGVAELITTDSMHSRKQLMFAEADAFVSLPGGLGTLDETVEIITWRQLGLHDKPILLCDIAGSAAPLLAAMEAAIALGFAQPERAICSRSFPAWRRCWSGCAHYRAPPWCRRTRL